MMRKFVLFLLFSAIAAGAVVALMPDVRQRLESQFPQVRDARQFAETATGVKINEIIPGKAPAAEPKAAPKRGPQSAPVTAAVVENRDMPIILSAAGSVEALASVAVRTRVDGQIVAVGFKEGEQVTEGQMLFQLDDRLVRAQIQQAEANVARDLASLADAEAILGRRESLIQKRITSEASLDTARATVGALNATIAASRAALDVQKTQLDYLTIRAPITARTGTVAGKLGTNVRAADTTPLVTLNQIRPIVVGFAMPQTDLTVLREALQRGAKAEVVVPGSKPLRVVADLTFVDNQVDRSTGTVTAKVTAANADEALWPGLAVEVELTVEVVRNVPTVPASAVLPAQQGMLAWIIAADNKVSPRPVVVERIVGQAAFIRDGLKAGERVVTDGQLRIAPGMTVTIPEQRPAAAQKKGPDAPAAADGGDDKRAPGSKGAAPEAKSITPTPMPPGRS